MGASARVTAFLSSPGTAILRKNSHRNHVHLLRSAPTCAPTITRTLAPRMVSTETKSKSKTKGGGAVRRSKKGSGSESLRLALEKYQPVIGVEVHVQLATLSKVFCACSTRPSRLPNVHVCPVCMGHPGALPVFNKRVAELATKAGLALGCSISTKSLFDRKNYYYADTSKNYQITQADHPIAQNGYVDLAVSGKRIRVNRLHIEEDSAKMSHEGDGRLGDSTQSYVDFNRAGIPLAEIVSEPDISSGAEAAEYGQELQRILRYVGASDCNMQDGSLRCDVNISIKKHEDTEYGTRVELKNLNSFGSVQKSVEYEIERQAALLDSRERVTQETRTWDEKNSKTLLMRKKEGSADYRYFPEPDLPPLIIEEASLEEWRNELPELPAAKRDRFKTQYGLSEYDAFLLADDARTAKYLDDTVECGDNVDPKMAANWIMGDITKVLKFEKITIDECKLRPKELAEMIQLIENGTISGKIAKDLVIELVNYGGSPKKIVEDRNLAMISAPEEIEALVQSVLDGNAKELAAYKEGKKKLFGFFVGQVMKSSGGRADPKTSNEILRNMLDGSSSIARVTVRKIHITCTSPPEREVADENDALQRELRAKVKELYGGAENVSIAVNGERAEFTVRRDNASDGEYRQAVMTVSSIALLSVLAGLVFAFMYNAGAIHGSPEPSKSAYPYHSSNARSRLDPYAMLGRDLDLGDF